MGSTARHFFVKCLLIPAIVTQLHAHHHYRQTTQEPSPGDSLTTIIGTNDVSWLIPGDESNIPATVGLVRNITSINVVRDIGGGLLRNGDAFDKYFILAPVLLAKPTASPDDGSGQFAPFTLDGSGSPSVSPSTPETTTPPDSNGGGTIGVNTQILSNCIFFTNLSYTCQSGCDSDNFEPISKEFPANSGLFYYVYSCSQNEDTPAAHWGTEDGIIERTFDQRVTPSQVVASCTFYQTNWFECYDVADCTRGPTRCRGGAPWRGVYTGTPQTSFQGNTTAKAFNNGGPGPLIGSPLRQQAESARQQKSLVHFCDFGLFQGTTVRCFEFSKTCNTTAQDNCQSSIKPKGWSQLSNAVRTKINEVADTVSDNPDDGNENTAKCYFYDQERAFSCAYPNRTTNGQLDV